MVGWYCCMSFRWLMLMLVGRQKRGATIIAEYLGGATNCDAYHMTDPRADGLGVSTCIQLALKNAQIEKEQVGRSFPLILDLFEPHTASY